MDKVYAHFNLQIQNDSGSSFYFWKNKAWVGYLVWWMVMQQTNTSDMLDLAVEYIKALQKQYKVWRFSDYIFAVDPYFLIQHFLYYADT